ncbi:glycoside hydrolase family 5 protein [Rudanella lutea]|uniref:glycoside hydrolase family 5 protein n=1 Tax=Rudanella lutea TaxID=451374 RepID=UPI000376027F|nr:cellulase family glycosylhydrolase [Rudanella lutea]
MNRRTFLLATTAAGAFSQIKAQPLPNPLPRWRGFNLLEKFVAREGGSGRRGAYRESDFEWMANWGFDFVRLPMSYRCWAPGDPAHWTELNETVLKEVDAAVRLGKQYNLHVNLNLHRIPGYCVNPPAEALNLWTDDRALEAAVFHWKHLAERYKGIPNAEVSFDLINEPANVSEAAYVRVVRALVEGIRSVDRERLIIADGLQYGTLPVFGLAGTGLGQSTRGYAPMVVSHYGANWVQGSTDWAVPTWPAKGSNGSAEALRRNMIEPWQKLQAQGVGIHVGEWGCYNRTPHEVALAWMEDQLKLWQAAGWGWSLWNLRGAFGILNSDRPDVAYKDFKGARLDEKMLELLRRY